MAATGTSWNGENMRADETILLAEDDQIVRDATKAVLEYGGYRVITAENGQEAVLLFNNTKIDLVLMDVVMPVMNGVEAYRAIKESAPDVRILFTSGFTSDILAHEGIDSKDKRLLQKPVSANILLKIIKATLDAPL
jgi:CheY-like chemotaxis protein